MNKFNICPNDNYRDLADGVRVSNDTRLTGLNNNDMIIGSSGSGKTGGYVIPAIQNITGSLVVTDTKGQLARHFTKQLQDKGYKVYTIDFVNPLNSYGYDPLKGIRRYADGRCREQDILTLANTIMPTLDSHEPFWEKAAAGYVAFLIAYCLEALKPEEQSMISVCELHNAFMMPNGRASFELWLLDNPNTFAARKFRQIKGSLASDKMWGSINEFANRALEPFTFAEASAIFNSPNSFDISVLGKEQTVLFLNVSDTDRTFDQLVNVFYTQTLQVLCSNADANPSGALDVPVRIIMDDFAAGTRIPDFDKVISVIRSREISVSLILQSLTQLESMYNHAESTTIINNCDHLLYLGCQDEETAKFIGCKAYKTPEAVLTTPRDKAIILTNGEKAKIVDKIKPYSTIENSIRLTSSTGDFER